MFDVNKPKKNPIVSQEATLKVASTFNRVNPGVKGQLAAMLTDEKSIQTHQSGGKQTANIRSNELR